MKKRIKKSTGLAPKLFDEIKLRGYISYGDMCQFTVEEGYKVSTAERRLRGLTARKGENGEEKDPLIFKEIKKSKRNTDYISGYFYRDNRPVERKIVYREKILSDGSIVMVQDYE